MKTLLSLIIVCLFATANSIASGIPAPFTKETYAPFIPENISPTYTSIRKSVNPDEISWSAESRDGKIYRLTMKHGELTSRVFETTQGLKEIRERPTFSLQESPDESMARLRRRLAERPTFLRQESSEEANARLTEISAVLRHLKEIKYEYLSEETVQL